MSSATTELQEGKNQFYRLLREFRQESRAITISSIALVVSVLALILTTFANNAANKAEAKVNYELVAARVEIQELREDIAVYRIRAAKLHAWLEANGVPIEEIVE